MKKIISALVALLFTNTSFCQQQSSTKLQLTASDYLTKSQRQKKTALYLVGGGAAMIIIGAVIPEGEPTGEINWMTWTEENKNDGIKGAFIAVGFLSMLSSVPFFIVSGKNKRRANAMSASFKNEKASIIQGYSFTTINYPALSINIPLN